MLFVLLVTHQALFMAELCQDTVQSVNGEWPKCNISAIPAQQAFCCAASQTKKILLLQLI